jgi:hypothetical protein
MRLTTGAAPEAGFYDMSFKTAQKLIEQTFAYWDTVFYGQFL